MWRNSPQRRRLRREGRSTPTSTSTSPERTPSPSRGDHLRQQQQEKQYVVRPPQPYMKQVKLHPSGCQQWSSQVNIIATAELLVRRILYFIPTLYSYQYVYLMWRRSRRKIASSTCVWCGATAVISTHVSSHGIVSLKRRRYSSVRNQSKSYALLHFVRDHMAWHESVCTPYVQYNEPIYLESPVQRVEMLSLLLYSRNTAALLRIFHLPVCLVWHRLYLEGVCLSSYTILLL